MILLFCWYSYWFVCNAGVLCFRCAPLTTRTSWSSWSWPSNTASPSSSRMWTSTLTLSLTTFSRKTSKVAHYTLHLFFYTCLLAFSRAALLCSYIVLVFWDHWFMLLLKIEFRLWARVCQRCGIFHYHWWTALIKSRLLFSPCKLCFIRTFPFFRLIVNLFTKILNC